MNTREQLGDLLRRHGVDDDALLDALKWKFRKIYTEKEMALRERDKVRAGIGPLREALEKIVLWCDTRHVATDVGKIARAALAKGEAGE
jgi:hypothetical protein